MTYELFTYDVESFNKCRYKTLNKPIFLLSGKFGYICFIFPNKKSRVL